MDALMDGKTDGWMDDETWFGNDEDDGWVSDGVSMTDDGDG